MGRGKKSLLSDPGSELRLGRAKEKKKKSFEGNICDKKKKKTRSGFRRGLPIVEERGYHV